MTKHIHVHLHRAKAADAWNESEHKRNHGQFSSTGGANSSGATKTQMHGPSGKENPGAGKAPVHGDPLRAVREANKGNAGQRTPAEHSEHLSSGAKNATRAATRSVQGGSGDPHELHMAASKAHAEAAKAAQAAGDRVAAQQHSDYAITHKSQAEMFKPAASASAPAPAAKSVATEKRAPGNAPAPSSPHKFQARDPSGNVVKVFHGANAEHEARQHMSAENKKGKGLSIHNVTPAAPAKKAPAASAKKSEQKGSTPGTLRIKVKHGSTVMGKQYFDPPSGGENFLDISENMARHLVDTGKAEHTGK